MQIRYYKSEYRSNLGFIGFQYFYSNIFIYNASHNNVSKLNNKAEHAAVQLSTNNSY